jgi:predicted Zn finger-like uncharacterized protein
MRIRCPSCSATYEVPDALLDPPRTVRCAKCAHDWMAVAEAEPRPEPAGSDVPVAPEPAFAAAREPMPEPAHGDTPLSAIERLAIPANLSPTLVRRDHLLTAAWAASFAILAALGVAGYTQRDLLMRQWPASKRVYSTLGLVREVKAGDAKVGDVKDAVEPATR